MMGDDYYLTAVDPPKWGWCAIGGVSDLLPPHERARRRQAREAFIQKQKEERNNFPNGENDSAIIETPLQQEEEKTNETTITVEEQNNNVTTQVPIVDLDSYHGLICGEEPRHLQNKLLLPNNFLTTVMDTNHYWDPNTVVRIIIRFPLTTEESPNAQVDNDNEYDEPVAGLPPSRRSISGTRRNSSTSVVSASNPSRSSKRRTSASSAASSIATANKISTKRPPEYFEDILEWDLGDPSTLSPALFAAQTAQAFGLNYSLMIDLQLSIERQISTFLTQKLNYRPPITVKEPQGTYRSDDENYSISQVVHQKSTASTRCSTTSSASWRSRISSASTSGGGFKRQYSNTSVETQSTAQIKESAAHSSRRYNADSDPRTKESHSPFFRKEVLQRFEAQSLCKPNTDGKVHRVQQVTNGVCHICHGRKPLTATFICGIPNHCYCETHLSTRLGIFLKELIGNTSENSKKYHEGYCPICTLYCMCSKCQRRLETIHDYVASLCWAEYGSNATTSDITESEVEKIVTRVVASLDLLCFAEGKERIPMFNETPTFTAASILAASKEPATIDTNITTKRRRSEEHHSNSKITSEVAAGRISSSEKKSQSSQQQTGRRGGDSPRRRSKIDPSEFPYEFYKGEVVNLPKGMNKKDVKAVAGDDTNIDYCFICNDDSKRTSKTLLCCDECPRSFHEKCLPTPPHGNSDDWICHLCKEDEVPKDISGQSSVATIQVLLSHHCYVDFNNAFNGKFQIICKLHEIVLFMKKYAFGPTFSVPVNTNEVKDYLDYVKEPMDLGQVQNKIENGHYIALSKDDVVSKSLAGTATSKVGGNDIGFPTTHETGATLCTPPNDYNCAGVRSDFSVASMILTDTEEKKLLSDAAESGDLKKQEELFTHLSTAGGSSGCFDNVFNQEPGARSLSADTDGKGCDDPLIEEEVGSFDVSAPPTVTVKENYGHPFAQEDVKACDNSLTQVEGGDFYISAGPMGAEGKVCALDKSDINQEEQGISIGESIIPKQADAKESFRGLNITILSILKDIELIWHNCFTYNLEASAIYRMAVVQRRKFRSLFKCSVEKDLDSIVLAEFEQYSKELERLRHGELNSNVRRIPVIHVPPLKTSDSKLVLILEPETNKDIHMYHSIARAWLAFLHLEKHGHKSGHGPFNSLSFKRFLHKSSKDSSLTLFGYRWLVTSPDNDRVANPVGEVASVKRFPPSQPPNNDILSADPDKICDKEEAATIDRGAEDERIVEMMPDAGNTFQKREDSENLIAGDSSPAVDANTKSD